jgi:peptidoglycan-associated lipoprotein
MMPRRLAFVATMLGFAALLLACPNKKPKYPACNGDKDCKDGEHCVNKKCVQCKADTDCAQGEQCVDGACQKKDGWCEADSDCPSGQVCKNNACVACQADDECGPGGRCQDGGCLRQGQCRSDDDCAEDEDCKNGRCVKAGTSSNANDIPDCTLEPIFFGFDQYAIPEEAKGLLEKNAECLGKTTRVVLVIGHTDPRGTDEYNIGLSDDRAQSVITYLGRLGVDPQRMRKVPKGEGEATGSDESGWAKDRRVELKWE